jgi:hypothetical protein
MDQCMNCTVRGNIDACIKTPCSQHESWYVQTLKTQQRTWVGLTDIEINDLVHSHNDFDGLWEFADAVEAKLKEKNT